MTIGPPPPFDPEAGAIWRSVSDGLFGGRGPLVDAEHLAEMRAFELVDPATLIASHGYVEELTEFSAGDVDLPVSVLRPEGATGPRPAILFIHGGGMVGGSRYGISEPLKLAAEQGWAVVSPDYRLAPEHPAPTPASDCVAAVRWCLANAGQLGIDGARTVLMGQSAGGGLAASVALQLRDAGGPMPAGLFLACPMLDDRMETVAARQLGDDLLWTAAANRFGWASLLGDRVGGPDVTPYDAPGRATELGGLPPTFIDVGSVDLFRDEDVAFASTIWASGGDCELHVWPGGYHGFEILAAGTPLSEASFEARRRWLARRLAG